MVARTRAASGRATIGRIISERVATRGRSLDVLIMGAVAGLTNPGATTRGRSTMSSPGR